MPPRRSGGEPSVKDTADTTERLLHVTVSQEHYRWLLKLAEERGSSIAVVAKQVFAEAVEQTIAAVPKEN